MRNNINAFIKCITLLSISILFIMLLIGCEKISLPTRCAYVSCFNTPNDYLFIGNSNLHSRIMIYNKIDKTIKLLSKQIKGIDSFEYSPVSNKVAYTIPYSNDKYSEIWISDIIGKNIKKITNREQYDSRITFSPNGNLIYFMSYSNEEIARARLYKIDIKTMKQEILSEKYFSFISNLIVSNDEKYIAFSSGRHEKYMFLFNIETKEVKEILGPIAHINPIKFIDEKTILIGSCNYTYRQMLDHDYKDNKIDGIYKLNINTNKVEFLFKLLFGCPIKMSLDGKKVIYYDIVKFGYFELDVDTMEKIFLFDKDSIKESKILF